MEVGMKKELNLGKASLLLEKLAKDTEDGILRWEKLVIVYSADESKKLVGQKKGYKFVTNISDTLSAGLLNIEGECSVYVERNGERIYVDEKLSEYPSIVSSISRLNSVVTFFSDVQIMKELDEYLGVPFDEKAYLINEDDE